MVPSYCHCTCRIPLFLLIILYISTFVTAKDYYPAQNTETKGESFFRVHFEKHGRGAVIKEIRKNNSKLPVRKENYFSCFAWEKNPSRKVKNKQKNKKILPESE